MRSQEPRRGSRQMAISARSLARPQSNVGGPGVADPQAKPSVAAAGGGCGCGCGGGGGGARGRAGADGGTEARSDGLGTRTHGWSNELVEVCRCLLVLHRVGDLDHLSPNGARQANDRARVTKMAKESTREDRMRVLIAIAEPVECALTGAGREQGERPFRKRLFQLAARTWRQISRRAKIASPVTIAPLQGQSLEQR